MMQAGDIRDAKFKNIFIFNRERYELLKYLQK